jgi:uncharacterized phage protein (TIGR02218 family)
VKNASSATRAILAAGEYTIAELFDLQLASKYGSLVYHFTSFDIPITCSIYPSGSPFTYVNGLTIKRGDLVQKVGTDGASLELTVAPQWDAGALGGLFTAARLAAPPAAADEIDSGSITIDTGAVTMDAGQAASEATTIDTSSTTIDSGVTTIDSGPMLGAGGIHFVVAPGSGVPIGPPTIAGFPFFQACRLGILDGAILTMSKMFFAPGSMDTSPGAVKWFVGVIGSVQAGRLKATIKASSPLALMTVQMPRTLFQVGCTHTVYDAGCALLASNFGVNGQVGAVASATGFQTTLTQPDNYFSKAPGQIKFTSGANAGFTGSIKSYKNAGGTINLFAALPNVPQPGDGFIAIPACDHLQGTCSNANPALGPPFNNLIHFRGMPYIPVPETTLEGNSAPPPAQTAGAQAGVIVGSSIASNFARS